MKKEQNLDETGEIKKVSEDKYFKISYINEKKDVLLTNDAISKITKRNVLFAILFVLILFVTYIVPFRVHVNGTSRDALANFSTTRCEGAPEKRIYDDAELLSDAEELALENQIKTVENEVFADIVIVTTNENLQEEYQLMNYADDFYDYNLFGFNKNLKTADGTSGDGILLLYCTASDAFWASSAGRLVYVYPSNTEGMTKLLKTTRGAFTDGTMFDASKAFIESVEGTVYKSLDGSTNPNGSFFAYLGKNIQKLLLILLISIVLAVLLILKQIKFLNGQEEDVTHKTYMEGTVKVVKKQDDFIRETRRVIKSSSSSGGNSHSSSSGSSHGGGRG